MDGTRIIGASYSYAQNPEPPTRGKGFSAFTGSQGHMPELQAPDGILEKITAAEAASYCGVSAQTIRKWCTRGYFDRNGEKQYLHPAGLDRSGRKLFRIIDVAKAEQATHVRARRDMDRYQQAS